LCGRWENEILEAKVVSVEDIEKELPLNTPKDVMILIGINNPQHLSLLSAYGEFSKAVGVFSCSPGYEQLTKYGSFKPKLGFEGLRDIVDKIMKVDHVEREAYEVTNEMWSRRSSGDLVSLFLVMINVFSAPVSSVVSTLQSSSTGLTQVDYNEYTHFDNKISAVIMRIIINVKISLKLL
jgi:hypothetical protein